MIRNIILLITNWFLGMLILLPIWNLFIVKLGVPLATFPVAFGVCMFIDYFIKDMKFVTIEGNISWGQFFRWYFKYTGLALVYAVVVSWILIGVVYIVWFGFNLPVWFGGMRV